MCFEKKCLKIKTSTLIEIMIFQHFLFFKKCSSLKGRKSQTTRSTVIYGVAIERLCPYLSFGTNCCLYDHWFGHSKDLKNRPTLEHAENQISLQFLRTLRLLVLWHFRYYIRGFVNKDSGHINELNSI